MLSGSYLEMGSCRHQDASGEIGPVDVLIIKSTLFDKEVKPVRRFFLPPGIHKPEILAKMLQETERKAVFHGIARIKNPDSFGLGEGRGKGLDKIIAQVLFLNKVPCLSMQQV